MLRGAVMMFFITMSINLYPKRKENSTLHFLFWVLVIMSGMLLISFGFMVPELKNSEQFHTFNTMVNLCLIPLISAYLFKIVIPDCINLIKTLLMQLPSVTFIILYLITHNKIMLTLSLIYAGYIAVTTAIMILVQT